MKIDFTSSGDDKKKKGHHFHKEVKLKINTPEELRKVRKQTLPTIEKEVNKILKDYAAGGLVIARNVYDKDNGVSGTAFLHMGVDNVEGLMKMAITLREGADHIMEMIGGEMSQSDLKSFEETVKEGRQIRHMEPGADENFDFTDFAGVEVGDDGKEDIEDLKDAINKLFG